MNGRPIPVNVHKVRLSDRTNKGAVKEYVFVIAPLDIPEDGNEPGTNIMAMLTQGVKKAYSSSDLVGRKSLVITIGDGIEFMVRAKWEDGTLESFVYAAGESRMMYDTEDNCVSQAKGMTKDLYEEMFINYIPGSDEPLFCLPTSGVNETDGLAEIMVATMGPTAYNVVSSNSDHTVLINRGDKTLRIFGRWDGDEFKRTVEWL